LSQLKGLIIDSPHIDNILSGRKTWEMRTTATKHRGPMALIKKGSGLVVGIADLIDSKGPLGTDELMKTEALHLISPERLKSSEVAKYKYAWVLQNPRRLATPISYVHPAGAVIWVNLDGGVSHKVEMSLRQV
jgi:hypothetical protein